MSDRDIPTFFGQEREYDGPPMVDIYRSNTGAADLIPNKITRNFWIIWPRRCGRTVMREHINGQTTGKHSEGDES